MADPKLVHEWLNKADEDFNFADANLKNGSTFYAQICFHFHQAAEKYLKAFIVAYDLELEKTHNPVHWPTNYTKEKALQTKESAMKIAEAIKGLLS